MDRFQRLAEFWQWLPAFRAVAESEHLPTAAESLHVTPSALSRSIRQLEAALGGGLFERVGRRLVLTPEGRELLEHVRDAMRRVDDGVTRYHGEELCGRVRIACAGSLSPTVLLPALEEVVPQCPEVEFRICIEAPDTVGPRLRRGELDLALQVFPIHGDGVESEALGELAMGVFAGPGHELRDRKKLTPEELVAHPFVGPEPGPDGGVHDGWPTTWPARRFAVQLNQVRMGVDAALRLGMLAVLPRVLVERTHADLRELELAADGAFPARPVFAVGRSALGVPGEGRRGAIDLVRSAVQRQFGH